MIMKRFAGKVLLELGTTMGSVDMVKYAKANGAYVIVSDFDNSDRSAAKRFADKTYMVSFKGRNNRDCEHLLITNYPIGEEVKKTSNVAVLKQNKKKQLQYA